MVLPMIRTGLLIVLASLGGLVLTVTSPCQASGGPKRSYIYVSRDSLPEGSAQMEVEELAYDDLADEPVIAHRGRGANRAVPVEALVEQGYVYPGTSAEFTTEAEYGTPLPTTLWGGRYVGRQPNLSPRPHCFTAPGYESACDEGFDGGSVGGPCDTPCRLCRGKVRTCRCRRIRKPCPPARPLVARRRCPPRRPAPCLEDRPEFSADSPAFPGDWSPVTPISPSSGDELLPPIQGTSAWRTPGPVSRSPAPVVRSRVIRSTAPTSRNVYPTGRGIAPSSRYDEIPWQAEPELGPELSMPE
jgi:hypothetical protein